MGSDTSSSNSGFCRWAIIPVVKVAQLEKSVDLPLELVEPWTYLQRHFGCRSDSGNMTSNMTLNFDANEEYVHRINANLTQTIMDSEEAFSRIMREVENLVRCCRPFPASSATYTVLDRVYPCTMT
jgi:hypothetical protein